MKNDIATSPELQRARDSAFGPHEVSFSTYDMGLKTLVNINGVFKELKVEYTRNPDHTIHDIKIKICN